MNALPAFVGTYRKDDQGVFLIDKAFYVESKDVDSLSILYVDAITDFVGRNGHCWLFSISYDEGETLELKAFEHIPLTIFPEEYPVDVPTHSEELKAQDAARKKLRRPTHFSIEEIVELLESNEAHDCIAQLCEKYPALAEDFPY